MNYTLSTNRTIQLLLSSAFGYSVELNIHTSFESRESLNKQDLSFLGLYMPSKVGQRSPPCGTMIYGKRMCRSSRAKGAITSSFPLILEQRVESGAKYQTLRQKRGHANPSIIDASYNIIAVLLYTKVEISIFKYIVLY